ncbi:MAG: cell division protein FtsL [Gammaproteobacteria bacterium]|nr:cell division protein FtsL [Gammaproteobacteria bacterium]
MKLLTISVLLMAVLLSAIKVVLAQHEARTNFIEIQQLKQQEDSLNEEWGKLQLEQSTWATDDRVEELARTKLNMTEANASSIVLIVQ